MIKRYLVIIIYLTIVYSDNLDSDISYINLPVSSLSNTLGNTLMSDIGNPGCLLTNPANIWSNKKISNKGFKISPSFNINLYGLQNSLNNSYGANIGSLFASFKINKNIFWFKDFMLGAGIVYYGVEDLEQYDDSAIFIDYFNYTNYMGLFGFSGKISIIQLGLSYGYSTSNFSITDYSNDFSIINTGFSIIKQPILKTLLISYSINYRFIIESNTSNKTTNGFRVDYLPNFLDDYGLSVFLLADAIENENKDLDNHYNIGLGLDWESSNGYKIVVGTGLENYRFSQELYESNITWGVEVILKPEGFPDFSIGISQRIKHEMSVFNDWILNFRILEF